MRQLSRQKRRIFRPRLAVQNHRSRWAVDRVRSLRILLIVNRETDWSGVQALLEAHEGWRLAGVVGDGGEAAAKAKVLRPDIIIIKSHPEDRYVLATSQNLAELGSLARFLIFSGDDSEDCICQALQAGAQGYILTSEFDRKIVRAIREVAQGRRFLSAEVTKVILRRFLAPSGRTDRSDGEVPLTPREVEIVRLLSGGSGNKQVAADLGIAVRTAETHRANIMKKLKLHSIAELIHFAIAWGIVPARSSPDPNHLTISE